MMLGMHGCFSCIEEYEIYIYMFTKISYCHDHTTIT